MTTGVSGATSTNAASLATQVDSPVRLNVSSTRTTSGLSASIGPLPLDVGFSSESGSGLSGLRLPQSSEDIAAVLAEVQMRLNGTMSQTRANGIVSAFGSRFAAIDTAATALGKQIQGFEDLNAGQASLTADQTSLATHQADLQTHTDDLATDTATLTADQGTLDAAQSDLNLKTADIATRQSQNASAQHSIDNDNISLGMLTGQVNTLTSTNIRLQGEVQSLTSQIGDAERAGDSQLASTLRAQRTSKNNEIIANSTDISNKNRDINDLDLDITQNSGIKSRNLLIIQADESAKVADQATIDTYTSIVAADKAKIELDNGMIAADNQAITLDNQNIEADTAAINTAKGNISDAQVALSAATMLVARQLALTSGPSDRSFRDASVSTQLDQGFERLQQSIEQFRKSDLERSQATKGKAPASDATAPDKRAEARVSNNDAEAAAPDSRAEAVALGLTAALEAARALLLQLAQQATVANASSMPNRLRLSL